MVVTPTKSEDYGISTGEDFWMKERIMGKVKISVIAYGYESFGLC